MRLFSRGVTVQSLPRSRLEVIEATLFLELPVSLLAPPAGLDGTGQLCEPHFRGKFAEVAFALIGGAALADQPYLFAGKILLSTDPLRRAARHVSAKRPPRRSDPLHAALRGRPYPLPR